MVRYFPVLILFLVNVAHADFLGFGSDNKVKSRIPLITEKLKKLEVGNHPAYEENFNLSVKDLENSLEAEKLYCSGEATDQTGKALPKDQKQLCFRELKKNYIEAMDVIFELKSKYLSLLHKEQMAKLSDIHKKIKADLEKNF